MLMLGDLGKGVSAYRTIASTPESVSRVRLAAWLLICCALLGVLVVVGGITRLTHSGLSIVEWQPVAGVLPPLSDEQWHEAFAKYQQTPEYQQVNPTMRLEDFRYIYWWEYAHRLAARLVGLAFGIPLIWFSVRREIPRNLVLPLLAILVLGGLQGLMDWYMVQSGLLEEPHVSQFRLTVHLGIAFVLFAAMFWTALCLLVLRPHDDAAGVPAPARWARVLVGIVFVMMLTGGMVAGTRAGFAFNTFPLMDGRFFPTTFCCFALGGAIRSGTRPLSNSITG